jgi:hypothetical protein
MVLLEVDRRTRLAAQIDAATGGAAVMVGIDLKVFGKCEETRLAVWLVA